MADDKQKGRRFPDGEVLDAGEGAEIARSSPTSIVVVAGAARCGKTTLVGGLYELFHRGPFGGYMFAGSRTLPGFELRCHLARIASGLEEEPDTERTPQSEGKHLLHLRLAEDDGSFRGVLFTDIYGEAFRRAADNGDDCKQFTVLRRADHVAVLVDGRKAADKRERQTAFAAADDLIGQCLDCGMFDGESSVQVVITKWDLVAGSAGDEAFVDGKIKWLNERYASKLGSLTSHKTSLRSRAGSGIELGHGMADLLRIWTQVRWRFPSLPAGGGRRYHTEFDRSEETFRVRG